MAGMSSGRRDRPSKAVKSGTKTTKKHRFETFNQRISKLDIDPVRKVRRQDVEREDLDVATSHFSTGLAYWRDLNLSENFTGFVQEVDPFCDSLVQILHYQQQVTSVLCKYIEKRDALSLEPLLSLVSHLAHDLGTKFEDHFAQVVTLVASLAATHPDVEVIEWSFTCLAWLFKFLSRLLVPDLRPVYDIMAPLLGKAAQKMFIARFAAEAMSFLIRKAALAYHKNKAPLRTIVEHIFLDLAELNKHNQDSQLYEFGIMTLFVDAIKGVNRELHSCGVTIFQLLLQSLIETKVPNLTTLHVLYGVTTNIIHHTDGKTFSPILNVIISRIKDLSELSGANVVSAYGNLLFIVTGVRKGSRILDWQFVVDSLASLLTFNSVDISAVSGLNFVEKAAAVILQYAPLDLIIAQMRDVVDAIASRKQGASFLPFCIFFNDLGEERFHSLLSPYLFKFVASQWTKRENELLATIPQLLIKKDSSALNGSGKLAFDAPKPWQQHIVSLFEAARSDDSLIFKCNSYLDLTQFASFEPSTLVQIAKILEEMVCGSLEGPANYCPRSMFTLGVGLEAYLRTSQLVGLRVPDIWSRLCVASDAFGLMPLYLDSLTAFCEVGGIDLSFPQAEILVSTLAQNLAGPSHELRKASLRLLNILYQRKRGQKCEILDTALTIETIQLDLQSARSASMHVRHLGTLYKAVASDLWLGKCIAYFCFGLLTFKLAQLWDDAVETLKIICDYREGEQVVSSLAFQWLSQVSSDDINRLAEKNDSRNRALNEFECSNIVQVERYISRRSQEFDDINRRLVLKFEVKHQIHSRIVSNAASQALRVLQGISQVAEKRSRLLVPIFLQWAAASEDIDVSQTKDDPEGELNDSVLPDEPEQLTRIMAMKDRKSMLKLFGCFTNPRVLFRSQEVFDALLALLANGDAEVQISALRAISTWKIKAIQPYIENLSNLLDESRFREEVAVFLQLDDQDTTIQQEHRDELMPVLLRLLYGRVISRTGTVSGRRGQAVRRKAVFDALLRLPNKYLQEFVFIALGPLRDLELVGASLKIRQHSTNLRLTERKKVGIVNMMKDLLETMGDRLAFIAKPIVNALLFCLTNEKLNTSTDGDTDSTLVGDMKVSLLKVTRQVGLQCLTLLFKTVQFIDLKPYVPMIFEELLSPRLVRLPVETAQSVSGILRLFAVWASSSEMVLCLSAYDPSLMAAVINCLDVVSAKDEVKLFVIESILKPLISLAGSSEALSTESHVRPQEIRDKLLDPNINHILDLAGALLKKSPSKQLLGSTIQLVSMIAPHVSGHHQIGSLVDISIFLLNQPTQRVSPLSKGDLLQVAQNFIPLIDFEQNRQLHHQLFLTTSSLYGYFKDRRNRILLSEVLGAIASRDSDLVEVQALCAELNSFSMNSVDEPDFDRRLKAFSSINEFLYTTFSEKQWRPIVYNMLFFIRDGEELAIRTNASFSLRRFVEACQKTSLGCDPVPSDLLRHVVLPALRGGAFEHSELVRAEFLSVVAHVVRYNPEWTEVSDMTALLMNDDEEASFFNNILHIQQHRRMRALRRLAAEAGHGHLKSANIAHFLIPLLEHFIFDKADDESAHNLAAEAINTIGALAEWLEWPQLRAMFRRFTGYIQSKPDLEKSVIKLLGAIIDAIGRAGISRGETLETISGEATGITEGLDIESKEIIPSTLSRTMPKPEKLTEDLLNNLLPSLVAYLHNKDESTVSLRVPVAVSVVKMLKLLPPNRLAERLPSVLTDVCQILRSRAQESRDLTRKTLTEIAILIGPTCFGFMLRELRSSLARGYQLHVLSYTVHSTLVATAPIFRPGDLDYCFPQIVSIIMDDIFGTTGQEKDAEEYISKMKEVKSSKSYDSMELLAKTATVGHLAQLIRPLQNLLEEKLDLKTVKKIDELLRRIGVGLLRNDAAQDRQTLVFCFEVIQSVYGSGKTKAGRTSKEDYRIKRYLVNTKFSSSSAAKSRSTTSYTYKLVRFSLDILRSILHKYDALRTPTNLSGFMPAIGDALLQGQEEVQISALRLLAAIIKVPLQDIDINAAIYVSEAVKMIRNTTSTNSEISQAALKLVSVIMRERPNVEIKESELAFLLKRLKPDLEEPDRQGVTFNFLKAVIAQKVIIPEVYEVLDSVAAMMVTNQTHGARALARSVYFQFILNYPQSKDRFLKQLSFLVKNLDYRHIEGRQSVMEAVHLLLSKVSDNLVQELVGTFFIPLIMVTANDDSPECRKMAGVLLKELFQRADEERIQNVLNLLRTWLAQDENLLLVRISLQVYCIYLEEKGSSEEKEMSMLQSRVTQLLKDGLEEKATTDWEVLYFALQMSAKLCGQSHSNMFKPSAEPLWTYIRLSVFFPHAWVKLAGAKLLGLYCADFARNNAEQELLEHPLKGSGGLRLGDSDMRQMIKASLGSLRVVGVSDELATQMVRNLLFLGRFAHLIPMNYSTSTEELDLLGEDSDVSENDQNMSILPGDKTALQYIFERLSALLRREPVTTKGPSLVPKTAALQLVAALCNHLSTETLSPSLETVLLPLHNLTDPSISAPWSADEGFKTAYKALISTSLEIMSMLQKKVGTTEYIKRLSKVREGVKDRREGRKVKRRLEAVTEPEKFGREKIRKGEKKKEKRKERSGEERSRRRGW